MKHLFILIAASLSAGPAWVSAAPSGQPNIVVILADDIGSGDISFYRERFMKMEPVLETPNIDALAENGMWFTDAHSSTSLCAPTRYAIMSGKNNYRSVAPWGVWNSFLEGAIKVGDTTLGTVARDAGYATGFVGKWHLGLSFKRLDGNGCYRGNDKDPKPVPADMMQIAYGGPKDMGFDYGYALPTGVQGPLYMAYENEKWAPFEADSKMICWNEQTATDPATVTAEDKKALNIEGNMTISDKGPGMGDSNWDTSKIPDIISRKAVGFINEHANKKPFFLYYCSPEAHRPHMPPAEMDGQKIRGTLPSRHMECIKVLDLEVKRIVDALKKNGVLDNTLVIFTADNGGLTWNVPGTMESGHRPSGLYRGAKSAPHEGGHRVPFIAHWPKKVKAGAMTDELVITHDLMATVAKIAGTKMKDEETLDSTNILPVLLGEGKFNPRDKLIWQAGASFEVMYREGGWKLIIQSSHQLDKWEPIALFNLESNQAENEERNLITHPEYKARAEKMFNEYMRIRESGVRTAPMNP
ncbi:Arylsulfatase [Pontiella desulfatans]|uniref:Arylsulfatase n=1 Tax=Pontiella desulfatans TaxID=2750659 RepID=A0A6C2UD46_PONDE|nr:arylsulfatase [Pontiella desulfatans]SPS74110.1 sulfatase S1_15 [Kiritimatiellales bacterium]VGO17773.1 Arylsulfatase [Pontiella desulfatans]